MGADQNRTDLPADETAPAVARRFVMERLAGHPRSSDVVLAVSEVVTNALRHGGFGSLSGPGLTLALTSDGNIRVEVIQPGAFSPGLDSGLPSTPRLGGLAIVAALASRWGVDRGADSSTTVWFEMT